MTTSWMPSPSRSTTAEITPNGAWASLNQGRALALGTGGDHAARAVEDGVADDHLGAAVAVHVGDRRIAVADGVQASFQAEGCTTSWSRRRRRAHH